MATQRKTLDWLDENSYRKYPFTDASILTSVDSQLTLADNVILDCSFVLNSYATVTLESIDVVGNTVSFNFSNGVSFDALNNTSTHQYVRLASGDLLVLGEGITDLTTEGTYIFDSNQILISKITVFDAFWSGVVSINFDSLGATSGDIKLIEGIQTCISANGEILSITADADCGIPLDCSDYADLPDDCSDIISYINGIGPDTDGVLTINSDSKTVIIEENSNDLGLDGTKKRRLYVGLDFDVNDICSPVPTVSVKDVDTVVFDSNPYFVPKISVI